MESVQTTLRVRREENLTEDILLKEIAIYEEINLEVENNLIKRKLEPLIEKLKKMEP